MRSNLKRFGFLTLAVALLWNPALAQDDARAITRLLLQAGNAEQKNDFDGAIAAYSQILQRRPDDATILVDRGSAYTDKRDFPHALADFSAAIKQKPGDALAYNDRGIVYLNLRDYPHAIADFDAAVRINPAYAGALEYRGTAHDYNREFPQAVTDYSAALRLQPDNSDALNGRCWDRAYLNRDLDGALADCTAALAMIRDRQTQAEIRDSRGFVYFRKGDMAKAIADYDAALVLAPKMAETLYKRGLAKNRKGENGKPDIAEALKRDPHAGDDMTAIGLRP